MPISLWHRAGGEPPPSPTFVPSVSPSRKFPSPFERLSCRSNNKPFSSCISLKTRVSAKPLGYEVTLGAHNPELVSRHSHGPLYFLKRFWREFWISSKFHKPVSKTYRPENDIFWLLITWSFLFWYLILRMRSLTWWRFYFRGKKYPKICLKIYWSIKTPWHRPRMGLARSGLWAPGYTIENYNIIHLKRLFFALGLILKVSRLWNSETAY